MSEDEGAVQVCATLSLSTEIDITITLTTSDGTGIYALNKMHTHACIILVPAARDDQDYIGVSMNFVFIAGSSNGSMKCTNVIIIDDNVVETNEIFTITLDKPIASSFVALGNNVTGVTITDTDSME